MAQANKKKTNHLEVGTLQSEEEIFNFISAENED